MAIPEDVMVQILLWLPVVSLFRFKCVYKSWYALTTHQNFIPNHFCHNLSTSNNNNMSARFLVHRRDKASGDYLVSSLSYEPLQALSLTQPLPPPYFGIDRKVDVFVVGSCNGLVCHYDSYDLNIVLWNLATKETKVVPKSTLPRSLAFFHANTNGIGFGFDAKTNDYKIINLLCFHHPNPNLSSFQIEFIDQSEVYSLSTNSWRKVDSPTCIIFYGFKGTRAYTNGLLLGGDYVGGRVFYRLT